MNFVGSVKLVDVNPSDIIVWCQTCPKNHQKGSRGVQRPPSLTFHAGGKTKATTMSSVEAVDKDVKTRRTAFLHLVDFE